VKNLLVLLMLVVAAGFVYDQVKGRGSEAPAAEPMRSAISRTASPSFTGATPAGCDGRTHCSQMRSCAEAKYFLAHCPNTKMDGDDDGVPCESQWCQ
jgi:hypothetical protein